MEKVENLGCTGCSEAKKSLLREEMLEKGRTMEMDGHENGSKKKPEHLDGPLLAGCSPPAQKGLSNVVRLPSVRR